MGQALRVLMRNPFTRHTGCFMVGVGFGIGAVELVLALLMFAGGGSS